MTKAFSRRLSSLLSMVCLWGTLTGLPANSQSITPIADDTGTQVTPDGNRLEITGGKLSKASSGGSGNIITNNKGNNRGAISYSCGVQVQGNVGFFIGPCGT